MTEALSILAAVVMGVGLAYLERRAAEKHVELAERVAALEVRHWHTSDRLDRVEAAQETEENRAERRKGDEQT